MDNQETRDELLIAAIDAIVSAQLEYEESHEDAGNNYAHMPAECWTETDNANLKRFMSETGIDACGLDIDAIAELALDNFSMRPEYMLSGSDGNYFACGAYPLNEIECQIELSGLSETLGFDVSASDIERVAGEIEYFTNGKVSHGAFFAYATSDIVWMADIHKDELQSLIKDAAQ